MWELEQCLPGERSIVAGEYLVVDDFGWKIRKIRAASHGWGGQIWAAGDQAAGQNGVFFFSCFEVGLTEPLCLKPWTNINPLTTSHYIHLIISQD